MKFRVLLLAGCLILSCTAKEVGVPPEAVVTPPPTENTGQDKPVKTPSLLPAETKPPEPKIDFPTRLNNLIKQLGDDDWHKREEATKEIQKIIDYYINGIAEDPEHLSPEMEYLVKVLDYASKNGNLPDSSDKADVEVKLRALRLYPPIKYRVLVHKDIAKLYPKVFDNLYAGEDDKLINWLKGQPKEIQTKALTIYREFLNSQNDEVRIEAVEQIGELQDTASLKQIFVLLNDINPILRHAAFLCVGKIGDESTIKDLLPLMQAEDADIRIYTAKSILALGGPDAIMENPVIDGLMPFLKEDTNTVLLGTTNTVLVETSNFMDKLGTRMAAKVPDILPLLKSENVITRQIATVVLSEIEDKSLAEHLLPLLQDCAEVQVWALYGLGKLKNPAAVKDIVPLLKNPDDKVREFAVFALDRIEDKSVVNVLMPLIKDASSRVRLKAIRAVNKLGGLPDIKKHALLKEIRPLLRDNNSDVVEEAVRTLGRLGDTSALNDILPLLNNNNSYYIHTRVEVIMALGRLGKEAVIKDLVPLLKESTARGDEALVWRNTQKTRDEVIRTLGRIGDRSVLKDLLPLLDDKNDDIKLNAAIVVTQFGDIRAVPVWIDLIDKYGIWYLSSYDDSVNDKWLRVTLDDVRGGYEFAREGLEKLTNKKMLDKDYRGQAKLWKEWWATEGKTWYEQELKKIEKKD